MLWMLEGQRDASGSSLNAVKVGSRERGSCVDALAEVEQKGAMTFSAVQAVRHHVFDSFSSPINSFTSSIRAAFNAHFIDSNNVYNFFLLCCSKSFLKFSPTPLHGKTKVCAWDAPCLNALSFDPSHHNTLTH